MGEINMNIYKHYNKPTELLQYSKLFPILKQQDIDTFFRQQRFPEYIGKGEDFISKDPFLAVQYAKKNIKGKWKKGEAAIARTAVTAYQYAYMALGGKKFPKGEDAIARSAYFSFFYANDVLKGRFKKGETAIATDGEDSFMYAKIIDAPFPEGEEAMKKTSAGSKGDGTYFDLYQRFLDNKKIRDAKMKDILDNDPLGIL